jgi:hypothetical protein
MRPLCFSLLMAIALTGWAQTGVSAVHTGFAIPDSSLYYANTPADDAFHDSTYTYFIFLPNKKICWFLSAVPPQQQDVSDPTGLLAGIFNYERQNDTLKFYRTFYDPIYNQTIGDLFTLTLIDNGIVATLDERIAKALPGNPLYYWFKLYQPKK